MPLQLSVPPISGAQLPNQAAFCLAYASQDEALTRGKSVSMPFTGWCLIDRCISRIPYSSRQAGDKSYGESDRGILTKEIVGGESWHHRRSGVAEKATELFGEARLLALPSLMPS